MKEERKKRIEKGKKERKGRKRGERNRREVKTEKEKEGVSLTAHVPPATSCGSGPLVQGRQTPHPTWVGAALGHQALVLALRAWPRQRGEKQVLGEAVGTGQPG